MKNTLQGIKGQKKGVSEMIGYVLLVSLAIVMAGLLYAWLSGWIPKDIPDCPEGTSLMVKDYTYDCTNQRIFLTIANNGRFGVGGYFIKATTKENQTVATTDLATLLQDNGEDVAIFENSVVIGPPNENRFLPNNETPNVFDLSSIGQQIYRVDIVPARWQKEDNRLRYIICGEDSTLKEKVTCTT